MPVIFDIKRFALHDGPGIRTTVFLKGCPLRCAWCHNPESQSSYWESYEENQLIDKKEVRRTRIHGKEVTVEALLNEILRDRLFFEESGGGVTFSGGEPLLQFRDLVRLLEALGDHGIHRAVDTSGHAPWEHLETVADLSDLVLFDLKMMDAAMHKKYTGVDNTLILENADRMLDKGYNMIFRIPVIPGINDTGKEVDRFLQFLHDRKGAFTELHLLPFHRIGSHKYRRLEREYSFSDLEEPSDDSMQQLKLKFRSVGVEVTIGG